MEDQDTPPRRGRKPGPRTLVNRAAQEAAKATGKLPHEILLDIARGTPLIQPRLEWDEAMQAFKNAPPVALIPDMQQRMAAARDAAPYYAPKLSALEILQGLSDADLDEAISEFAAQAGLGIAVAGEGEAPQEPAADAGRGAAPADRSLGNELGDDGGASAP